jgi:lipopolysaccharide exporter
MGVARVVADTGAFAGSLVLVRFIPPSEFGRAAVALGFAAIAPNVLTQTFGAPIVQFPRLEREHAESAMLLSLAAGLLFVVLAPAFGVAVLRPLVGNRAAYLFVLTTPAFAAAAVSAVPRGLIQRSLEFRKISIVEIAGLVGTTLVSTFLATLAGLDGEALVLGFAAGQVTTLLLLLVWAPRTAPRWHGRGVAGQIVRFGGSVGLSSALATLSQNIDYLALSTRVSAATVGFYWRGFVLAVTYPGRITSIMLSLALPLYSRAENEHDMRRLRLRVMATHAAVMFPLLATLIVVAPILVPWLFGTEWKPSVVPTQFLAGSGMVAAIVTGTGAYITALGKPKYLPIVTLVATVGLGSTAYFAAPLGLNRVAACVLGYYLAFLLFNHLWVLHHIGGIPVGDLFRDALPPLVAAAPLAAIEFALMHLLQAADAPTPVILAVTIPPGIAAYCGVLATAFPDTWRALRSIGTRILGRQT